MAVTACRLRPVHALLIAALLGPVVGLFAPLGMVPVFVLASVVALAAIWRDRPWAAVSRPLAAIMAAIVLWGALTALWAPDPMHTLRIAASFLGLAACGLVLCAAGQRVTGADRRLMLRLLLIASGAALTVVVADVLTCGRLVAHPFMQAADLCQSRFVYKRGLTVALILLLPAITMAGAVGSRVALAATAVLLAAGGIVGWWSGASTLSAAVAAAAAAAFLVRVFDRKALAAMGMMTVLMILAMPAIVRSLPAPGFNLSFEATLPLTLHHRFTIWHFAGERWQERPVIGWGMDSARSIPGGDGYFRARMDVPGEGWRYYDEQLMPLHPHNAVVQWWVELGVPGALLLIGLVAVVFRALARLPGGALRRTAPAAAAALALVVSLASFGAWQSWWLATLWVVAALFAPGYDPESSETA